MRSLDRQVSSSFSKPAFVLPALLLILSFSCTVPKKFQAGKPFVFEVHIKVEGSQQPSDKKDLEFRLMNQLDDSLRTQVISYFGVYQRLVSPPVLDTTNVRRSIDFMVALLNSLGYYAPTVKDSIHIRQVHDQLRATVNFRVNPGKQQKFDSIGYNLETPALQALALQSRQASLLKKGNPYSIQVVSAELDRLVTLFRNNGYFKFSKQDLVAVQDTVVAALIDPTLDPFQQAALLQELKRKRAHPSINVIIQQRPIDDSSRIMQYYIGHVTIYPDLPLVEDTIAVNTIDTSTTKGFTVIARTDKFKPAFLTRNVYLRPGSLYKQFDYIRTLNRFNQLGAWQQATIPALQPSDNADSLLDVILRLYPAKKQYLSVDLEASRNTNDIVTATNLFGVGLNLGLRNRNTFRESVLSSTDLRGGVELGSSFIQTTQLSLTHSIYFPKKIRITPRPVSNFLARLVRMPKDSIRTVLTTGAAYTDLLDFFALRSVNTSWGYEWSKGNRSFTYRPLNVEYTRVIQDGDSLSNLFDSFPSLKLAFRSGLVIGQQFVYSSAKQTGIHTNFLRFSAEESGALTGFVKPWDEGELFRYIKADIEFRRHIDYRRTELAMRLYAGAGWAYGREGNGYEQTLPFYKAFFAGGPNSMRGWQVRQLGIGSTKFYDTLNGGKFTDKFGDVQLEGNMEYRFPLGTVFTIKVASAVYVDAGNIWDRHQIDSAKRDVGSDFRFNRFYNEIAVDAGTGLRLIFTGFVIRFDYAYKLRDPTSLYYSNRWFYGMQLFNGQFQLGINYPF